MGLQLWNKMPKRVATFQMQRAMSGESVREGVQLRQPKGMRMSRSPCTRHKVRARI